MRCLRKNKVRRGYSRSGEQCKNNAVHGYRYCYIHVGKIDTSKGTPIIFTHRNEVAPEKKKVQR